MASCSVGIMPCYVQVVPMSCGCYVCMCTGVGCCLSLIVSDLHLPDTGRHTAIACANLLGYSELYPQMFSPNHVCIMGAGFADAFRVGVAGARKHI